jgi:hypothetical protein
MLSVLAGAWMLAPVHIRLYDLLGSEAAQRQELRWESTEYSCLAYRITLRMVYSILMLMTLRYTIVHSELRQDSRRIGTYSTVAT